MTKTIINIRADKDVKVKAQKVAKRLGLPLSTVINGYLREFVRTETVHFSLRDSLPLGKPEGVLKPAVKRRLAKLHKDVMGGKNLAGPFHSPQEIDAYLKSL